MKLPRAWRRFNQVLKGRMPKQIVAGHLTGFGPAESPGICYAFGEQRVNVALPFWNEVSRDTRDGFRPLAAAALTDLPVRLHLLTLSPDTPPVLLRAEYPMSTQVWNSVEEISDADREAVRNEELSLRKFFYVVALAVLVGSLFWSPLILLAGFLPAGTRAGHAQPQAQARAVQARRARGGRGSRDLSLAHDQLERCHVGSQLSHRGLMYRVEHFGPVAEPGQRVEFEYLDGSDFLGPRALFFRIEDQPVMTL